MQADLKAGATEEEIFEAIEIASLAGGAHTMTDSLPICREGWEAFRKGRKNAHRQIRPVHR